MADPVNIPYSISSGFGQRTAPTAGASTNHAGIDIAVPYGTIVQATEAGKITEIGSSAARGNYIRVLYNSGYSGLYQHLDSTLAKVGDTVSEGAAIALSGNSGISTGPHLHFEVKNSSGQLIDPEKYLKGLTSTNSAKQQRINRYIGAGSSGSGIPGTLSGAADNITAFIKDYWLFIAAALVVVGVLRGGR